MNESKINQTEAFVDSVKRDIFRIFGDALNKEKLKHETIQEITWYLTGVMCTTALFNKRSIDAITEIDIPYLQHLLQQISDSIWNKSTLED